MNVLVQEPGRGEQQTQNCNSANQFYCHCFIKPHRCTPTVRTILVRILSRTCTLSSFISFHFIVFFAYSSSGCLYKGITHFISLYCSSCVVISTYSFKPYILNSAKFEKLLSYCATFSPKLWEVQFHIIICSIELKSINLTAMTVKVLVPLYICSNKIHSEQINRHAIFIHECIPL